MSDTTPHTAAPVVPGKPPASTGIGRWQMPALIIGILGLIASGIGYFTDPQTFFRAYLPSYLFWFQIVAGSLAVLCLQYVTGGEWGVLIRRPLGAAARTMMWMAVFFLPIVFGLRQLYPWMNREWMNSEPSLQYKAHYLNDKWFLIRTAIEFALWILWAWRIRYLSLSFAKTRSPYTELARRKWSALGLLMMVVTLSFASFDWAMSLEPKWYSTMYGISFVVGSGLCAFAFVTFFLTQLASAPAMAAILKPSHFRDLGNLMFAFTMLWAYTAFSQFLLIWYANLKEEIPYYLKRENGFWGVIAICLIIFHFFLPFFMLLMRGIKDRPQTIAVVTVVLLFMRYVDIYWLTAPGYYGRDFHYSWMSVATMLGIGGIWMFAFIAQLKGQSIIPIHETWVDEAIREGALNTHG